MQKLIHVFTLTTENSGNFGIKIYKADIPDDLKGLSCPVLALSGNEDENVDTKESIVTFNQIFRQNTQVCYKGVFFSKAEHALFYLLKKGKPGTREDIRYKHLCNGSDVYTPDFIESTVKFVSRIQSLNLSQKM